MVRNMDSRNQLKAAILAHREQLNAQNPDLSPQQLDYLLSRELASTNSQASSATPRSLSNSIVPQKRASDFGMEPPSKRSGPVGSLAAFRPLTGLTSEGVHGLYSTILSARTPLLCP